MYRCGLRLITGSRSVGLRSTRRVRTVQNERQRAWAANA
jgi:hypothetical protein